MRWHGQLTTVKSQPKVRGRLKVRDMDRGAVAENSPLARRAS
jgi:hypothetical protein